MERFHVLILLFVCPLLLSRQYFVEAFMSVMLCISLVFFFIFVNLFSKIDCLDMLINSLVSNA